MDLVRINHLSSPSLIRGIRASNFWGHRNERGFLHFIGRMLNRLDRYLITVPSARPDHDGGVVVRSLLVARQMIYLYCKQTKTFNIRSPDPVFNRTRLLRHGPIKYSANWRKIQKNLQIKIDLAPYRFSSNILPSFLSLERVWNIFRPFRWQGLAPFFSFGC